jgi:predicted Fe-Mo cluster-binding NifX family protein
VLICGAISRPLEAMLLSAGVEVIPQTCGPVEEVLKAFMSGKLTEKAFLMPGCCGRRRRFHDGRSGVEPGLRK